MRVAITGVGAVSGFGRGAETLWRGLVEGKRAMRERQGLPAIGPISLFEELPLDAPERAAQMALLAIEELEIPKGRIGVTVGTTLGGIGGWLKAVRENSDAGPRWSYGGPAQMIAHAVGATGPVQTTSVACASGNVALGAALDLIRSHRADVVIAGGVDALHDFVVAGFATLKAADPEPCRPFDKTRKGLNLGEGACFLLLESEAHARARGAQGKIRAFLDGYGVSADAVHMTGPDREGRGAARAMAAALADARLTPSQIGYVSAHGTATPFNDLMEAKALAHVFGEAIPPVNSIKSAVGHTLGASGALEALLCIRTLETGLVTPTIGLSEQDPEIALDVVRDSPRQVDPRAVLSTSSGFGGTNASIVLVHA